MCSASPPSTCLWGISLAVHGRSTDERPEARARLLASALARDPLRHGLRRHRPAEAKTLERMHPGRAQEQMLLGSLHAFRRHPHAEPAAEADHGVDDGGGVRGTLDIGDEAAVDLQAVERERAQIQQTRVAGPEIV